MRTPSTTHPIRRHSRTGLGLLEVIITVIIIGIMAAVTGPRISASIVRYQVEAAARRVAADLNHARQNAMTFGTDRTVTFNVASHSYDLAGIADMDHSSQEYSVSLADTGYASTLVSVDFGSGTSVTFSRYGRPDNGGTVVVTVGGEQRSVVVNPATGKAIVQ